LRRPGREIAEHFGLRVEPRVRPRYNVAPGQEVAVVRALPGAESAADAAGAADGGRVAESRLWGLVPPWAKDPRIGARLVNARSETAATRNAFAPALRARRCLIPADGFYEWGPAAGGRAPYHVTVGQGELFAMAGLYETWQGAGGEVVESCTILTTAANRVVAAVHDRMPVILAPRDYAAWLDPACRDPRDVAPLLASRAAEGMQATRVSTRVNRVENDDAACLEPPAPEAQGTLF
jgi:putative SOS response-associated peptidase YedK